MKSAPVRSVDIVRDLAAILVLEPGSVQITGADPLIRSVHCLVMLRRPLSLCSVLRWRRFLTRRQW